MSDDETSNENASERPEKKQTSVPQLLHWINDSTVGFAIFVVFLIAALIELVFHPRW